MNNVILYFENGDSRQIKPGREGQRFFIDCDSIPEGVSQIDFMPDFCNAAVGTDGFYLLPGIESNASSIVTYFRERPDSEYIFKHSHIPIFGVKHGDKAFLAVVTGMAMEYSLVLGQKGDNYYLFPRFILNGERPYEAPAIEFLALEGAGITYADMARRYRQYQLDRGACIPLRERAKKYPALADAARGIEVRVRHAWKPVPSPVLEQTLENEPPVHVAVDFKRLDDIIEEFHKQGVKDVEFCLVGWNASGHDGRFPDIFPVEPLLGTEEELMAVIQKARSYGYLISGHTNLLDAYTISERLDMNDLIRRKDGTNIAEGVWGGGQSYRLCPKVAQEKFAPQDFDDMARLGFYGMHYLDVMTICIPDPCYHPDHPLNRKEAGAWRGKTMAMAREKVGGSASEGSWDFCIGDTDYVLYTVFSMDQEMPALCDEKVPFWHLVYHGIVLYNTFSNTVNAMIKSDPDLTLKNIEHGGRPLAYFYSKFRHQGLNWMGVEDLLCNTDEELTAGVAKIKADLDKYQEIRDLQYEFLEDHKTIADGVVLTRYSNGSEVVINYNDTPYQAGSVTVPPKSYLRSAGQLPSHG